LGKENTFLELKNLMEAVVSQAIDDIRKHYIFCSCSRCRLDITAIALNKILPRYVVSEKGESYGRAELLAMQGDLDILSIVLDSVKKVQQNPRHGSEGRD
jgi:competence protein ComFB